jgi:hypothetical protein
LFPSTMKAIELNIGHDHYYTNLIYPLISSRNKKTTTTTNLEI